MIRAAQGQIIFFTSVVEDLAGDGPQKVILIVFQMGFDQGGMEQDIIVQEEDDVPPTSFRARLRAAVVEGKGKDKMRIRSWFSFR